MPSLTTEAQLSVQQFYKSKDNRYLFLAIDSEHPENVVVTARGDATVTWSKFVESLPEDKPCWAVVHFNYRVGNPDTPGLRSKSLILQWIPSRSTVRDKMQYTFFSNDIRRAIGGGQTITGHNPSDLDVTHVLDRVTKYERDPIDITYEPCSTME